MHPAPGIVAVTRVSGNQVDVDVGNRLACGWTIVDGNVVTGWIKFFVQDGRGGFKQGIDRDDLCRLKLKVGLNMAFRYDECVPWGDRVSVTNDKHGVTLINDTSG